MSIPVIVLNTNKNSINIGNNKITIRQSERGLTLTAIVKNANGTNYDFSNKTVQFAENKDGQRIILDENVQIDSTSSGTIHYTLNKNVFSASGEAWFEIKSANNSIIDTTNNFSIECIKDAEINVSNDNYISSLSGLIS